MSILAYIFISLAFGFVIGRYHDRVASEYAYQNHSEALVASILQEKFNSPDYHLLNHITLKLGNGSTQIDHILISRFGVFVIETKNYNGWIFADAKHEFWTQVLFRDKFKFQNPIFQNYRHVVAVQSLLEFIPSDFIKSAVVFTGGAEFIRGKPSGVFDIPDLIKFLENSKQEVMSINRVQFCVGRIETARLAISRDTDVEHVQNLQRRYGNKV